MAGGIGGVMIQLLSGKMNDVFSATPKTAYFIMFCVCALGYIIAWSLMKTLVPRHKPITDL
jgi:MFS transporter, ACS family, hexuronate transporter